MKQKSKLQNQNIANITLNKRAGPLYSGEYFIGCTTSTYLYQATMQVQQIKSPQLTGNICWFQS